MSDGLAELTQNIYRPEETDKLLSVICNEPTRLIVRNVYWMHPTPEAQLYLWHRLRGLPSMFSSTPLKNIEQLQPLFETTKILFLVDDIGIIGINLGIPPAEPDVHVTFWDKRLRGREGLCRAVAERLLRDLRIERLWTAIPSSARATRAFAKRIGFRMVDYRANATVAADGSPDDLIVLVYGQPTDTVSSDRRIVSWASLR